MVRDAMAASVVRPPEENDWGLASVLVVGVLRRQQAEVVEPLPAAMRVVDSGATDTPPVAIDLQRVPEYPDLPILTAVPVVPADGTWFRAVGRWSPTGSYLVAGDSRLRELLMDLANTPYASPVALHVRRED